MEAGDAQKVRVRIQGSSNIVPWNVDWFEHPMPGSQYRFSVGGTNRHLVTIHPIASAYQDPGDPSDWHPLTLTFSIPEGVGDSSLIINVYNDTDQSLWIDDISLQML